MSSMPKVADFENGKAFGDLPQDKQSGIIAKLDEYEMPNVPSDMPTLREAHTLLCIVKPCFEDLPAQLLICESLDDVRAVFSRENLYLLSWYRGRLPDLNC